MSDTKEEIMSTRRTRLSALRSEENSHYNDGSGDEIVRCILFVVVYTFKLWVKWVCAFMATGCCQFSKKKISPPRGSVRVRALGCGLDRVGSTGWCQWCMVEHSDSEKNIPIRLDFLKQIDFFDSIRFSTSLPFRRIGYYRLLCCQMSMAEYGTMSV